MCAQHFVFAECFESSLAWRRLAESQTDQTSDQNSPKPLSASALVSNSDGPFRRRG